MPELYSAQFNVGLPTVEAGLSLIRYHLGLVEDEDDEEDEGENLLEVQTRLQFMTNPNLVGLVPADESAAAAEMAEMGGSRIEDVAGFFGLSGLLTKRRVQDSDAVLVEKRKAELRWLRKMVEDLKEADERERAARGYQGGIELISALVGHRGYHSIKDNSSKRPIENSLVAYEAAWTNGIHSCECDIALTADDKLILAHDENFVRLALDKDDPWVHKNVRELTYREIMSLPLKSGVRPPLLFDVLRSAYVIGGDAKMIVEIKPGNVEAGTALAKMFARHPHLMERVSVVMSFDAYAMQKLKRELEVVFPSIDSDVPSPTKLPSPPSRARVGSPETHELAAAGLAIPDRPNTAGVPRPVHGHRRGVSMGGAGASVIGIPSSMSIGDVHSLVPPLPQLLAEQPQGAGVLIPPPGAGVGGGGDIAALRSRSKSIDQLGFAIEGLDIDGGLSQSQRKDSYNFSPFKQITRVPSMARQKSTRLEPIPGGVRVENAAPHPPGASADVLSMTPPQLTPILACLQPPASAPTPGAVPVPVATTVAVPQLLLITRCGPPQNKEQEGSLEVDISKPSDIKRARAWLHGTSPRDRLDGLYMQYQPIMMQPEGIVAMRSLSDHYVCGSWGANPKHDDYKTFSKLVRECGVQYVNSGLPKKFLRNMQKSTSSGNLLATMESVGGTGDGERLPSAADFIEMNYNTQPAPPKETVRLGLPW